MAGLSRRQARARRRILIGIASGMCAIAPVLLAGVSGASASSNPNGAGPSGKAPVGGFPVTVGGGWEYWTFGGITDPYEGLFQASLVGAPDVSGPFTFSTTKL